MPNLSRITAVLSQRERTPRGKRPEQEHEIGW